MLFPMGVRECPLDARRMPTTFPNDRTQSRQTINQTQIILRNNFFWRWSTQWRNMKCMRLHFKAWRKLQQAISFSQYLLDPLQRRAFLAMRQNALRNRVTRARARHRIAAAAVVQRAYRCHRYRVAFNRYVAQRTQLRLASVQRVQNNWRTFEARRRVQQMRWDKREQQRRDDIAALAALQREHKKRVRAAEILRLEWHAFQARKLEQKRLEAKRQHERLQAVDAVQRAWKRRKQLLALVEALRRLRISTAARDIQNSWKAYKRRRTRAVGWQQSANQIQKWWKRKKSRDLFAMAFEVCTLARCVLAKHRMVTIKQTVALQSAVRLRLRRRHRYRCISLCQTLARGALAKHNSTQRRNAVARQKIQCFARVVLAKISTAHRRREVAKFRHAQRRQADLTFAHDLLDAEFDRAFGQFRESSRIVEALQRQSQARCNERVRLARHALDEVLAAPISNCTAAERAECAQDDNSVLELTPTPSPEKPTMQLDAAIPTPPRREPQFGRIERLRHDQQSAATQIAIWFRTWKFRKHDETQATMLRVREEAAVQQQKAWRGYASRKKFRVVHCGVKVMQKYCHAILAKHVLVAKIRNRRRKAALLCQYTRKQRVIQELQRRTFVSKLGRRSLLRRCLRALTEHARDAKRCRTLRSRELLHQVFGHWRLHMEHEQLRKVRQNKKKILANLNSIDRELRAKEPLRKWQFQRLCRSERARQILQPGSEPTQLGHQRLCDNVSFSKMLSKSYSLRYFAQRRPTE